MRMMRLVRLAVVLVLMALGVVSTASADPHPALIDPLSGLCLQCDQLYLMLYPDDCPCALFDPIIIEPT